LQEDENAAKKAKVEGSAVNAAATLAPTLNYVGTNLAVPLSLGMTQVVATGKKKAGGKGKTGDSELNTEGLPPNAVDAEGNILVTDYDILVRLRKRVGNESTAFFSGLPTLSLSFCSPVRTGWTH